MSANPHNPAFPNKPLPPVNTDQSGSSAGRLFGCAAIGCGSIVLLCLVLCGFGYWAVFYSSYPLMFIESGLESEGYVEIEGMKGNISTGVSIDSLRFRENRTTEEWSELKKVEVKYKQAGSMFSSRELIIEKIALESGRFPVDMSEEMDLNLDFDFSELVDEVSQASGKDFRAEMRGGFEIREISLRNIVFADKKTGREIGFEEIRFDGLEIENGSVKRLGDVRVRSDFVAVDTDASPHFPDDRINRQFNIVIKKMTTPDLENDLPLSIDLGITDTDSRLRFSLMDDEVQIGRNAEGLSEIKFVDCSPASYFSVNRFGILPSNANVTLQQETGGSSAFKVTDAENKFMLGKTTFVIDPAESRDRELAAFAEVKGVNVRATLILSTGVPVLRARLEPAGDWSLNDTWAMTVFGAKFDEIEPDQQKSIEKTVAYEQQLIDGEKARQSIINGSRGESNNSDNPDSDNEQKVDGETNLSGHEMETTGEFK